MFRVIGGIAVTAVALAVLAACGDDAPEIDPDATTVPGGLLWRYQTEDDVISSPAVVDGVVYVGSADNYLYAVSTGR